MSAHPLDPLTPEELARAVEVVRRSAGLGERVRFIRVELEEPDKPELARRLRRRAARAFVVILDNDAGLAAEAIVDLEAGSVERWTPLDGRPAGHLGRRVLRSPPSAVRADPRYREALARRGIEATPRLGAHRALGDRHRSRPAGRRLARALSWLRSCDRRRQPLRPADRAAWSRVVDLNAMEVVRVDDHGAAAAAASRRGDYRDGGGRRRTATTCGRSRSRSRTGPASRSTAASCAGRSGGCGSASRTARASCCTRSRYEDDGELRADLPPRVDRRAGDPLRRPQPDDALQERVRHRRVRPRPADQRAGAGLRLPGRDPLPGRRVTSTRTGRPCRCCETRSASTRRTTGSSGSTATTAPAATTVARSRRLVVSCIATVGNYEYGFFWYLYQDGTIEFEGKLTGIVHTAGVPVGEPGRHATEVSPGVAAGYHQHFFTARLDMDVDGTDEHRLSRSEAASRAAPAPTTRTARAFVSRAADVHAASRRRSATVSPLTARRWRVENPRRRNRMGEPVGLRARARRHRWRPMAQPDSQFRTRAPASSTTSCG